MVKSWLEGFDVDLLTYGQTGSGKTFTMFGPPFAMEQAAKALSPELGRGTSGEGIVLPEHGVILRSGFEALAALDAINAGAAAAEKRAVLHGSMVEVSIVSMANQTC